MVEVELKWLHALPVSLRNVQVPVLIIFREREGGAVIYEHSWFKQTFIQDKK